MAFVSSHVRRLFLFQRNNKMNTALMKCAVFVMGFW